MEDGGAFLLQTLVNKYQTTLRYIVADHRIKSVFKAERNSSLN